MKNASIAKAVITLLSVILFSQLFACGGPVTTSVIETVVAETVAAITPAQGEVTKIVEVTKVKEITKIVPIEVTTTPKPTERASATPTPSASPTGTPTPTRALLPNEPTIASTVEPSGVIHETLNQFIALYKAMTDLQKAEYVASLPGKSVSWTAQVDNVTGDGTVILKAPFAGGTVILLNIPAETAIELDRKMLVDFSGMIISFSGNISPEVTLDEVTIRRYYHLPTATPTP
ncbi:MAG: hypothetical protein ACOYYS_06575 [Chloroflexota bacterium]